MNDKETQPDQPDQAGQSEAEERVQDLDVPEDASERVAGGDANVTLKAKTADKAFRSIS